MTTRFETLERTVSIPDQVSVQVEGRTVKVKGPLGSLQEDLSHLPVSINVNDNKVRLETTWLQKREIGMLGTAAAHVRNMLKGVTQGYRYELRTVYAHFPVTVKADAKGKLLRIDGFPAKVKNGYGSTRSTRGLHPRCLVDMLVWREVELEKLDPKVHIVRIAARVGEKKRRGILAKAKDLNFHIANPGKEEGRAVTETPALDEEKALPAETGEEKMEEKTEIAVDEDLDKTEESSE